MTQNKSCENCGNSFPQSKNKQAKFCRKECRKDYAKKERKANKKIVEKNCLQCDKKFIDTTKNHVGKFCSNECWYAHRNEQKFIGKQEGIDYIHCPICNQKMAEISAGHAKQHGFKSPRELAKAYNLKSTKCQKGIDRFAGKNNPGYQHGGLLSPFSKNNTNITEEERLENQKNALDAAKGTRPNEIQSWLNKGYTEEEAKQKVSERQRTFSLDICIGKYGEEKGLEIWLKRQEKWLNSYEKLNFSKVSQKLFWQVYDFLYEDYNNPNIFFATKDENGQKSESKKNHELRLTFPQRTIIPDFINTETKHVIEFDGDYWHRDDMRDHEKEEQKVNILEQNGYKVLRIKECDYTNNPNGEIEKCIKFLMT